MKYSNYNVKSKSRPVKVIIQNIKQKPLYHFMVYA